MSRVSRASVLKIRQLHIGQRLVAAVSLLLLSVVTMLPAFTGNASAATLASRSITLGSSTPSAANVAYKVSFTVANAATNIGGIAIDFCYDSPIIGLGTCTNPTGLNSNSGTLSVNNQTNISGLSVDTANSSQYKVILTKTAGAPTAAAITFALGNGTSNGFTNPSTVSTSSNQGTFYARIYTYATSAAAQAHSTLSPTGYTDAGGAAMSVASQLTVTAKVQETLSFCVYTGASCTAGGTAIALGDANGVLTGSGTVYTATSKFDVGSNANSGVTIRLKGDTLKSGSDTIAAAGFQAGPVCVPDVTTSTTDWFGVRISAIGSGQSSIAPYNGGSGCHALDVSTACNTTGGFFDQNVTCTYGDQVASTAGPTSSSTSTVEYAAKSATTTKPGAYTTNLAYVATGTY